jgi:hypothetical protein
LFSSKSTLALIFDDLHRDGIGDGDKHNLILNIHGDALKWADFINTLIEL